MRTGPLHTYARIATYDVLAFFILGILSLILSFILIVGFLRYKKLRESPGDLVLMISIGGFLLSCHWVISAVYSGHLLPDLSNDPDFCIPNAIVSVACGSLIYLYNVIYCIYCIASLQNVLRASIIPRKILLHSICIILTIANTTYNGLIGSLGKSIYGTCSVKVNESGKSIFEAIQYLCLVVVYIVLAFWSYFYIRARRPRLPDSIRRARKVKVFLNHYLKFVLANSIIWLIMGISYLLAMIFAPSDNPTPDEILRAHILTSLGNATKMAYIAVLLIMRMTDPLVARTMKKVICFWRKKRIVSIRSSWSREVEGALSNENRRNRINTFKLTPRCSQDGLQEPLMIEESREAHSSEVLLKTTDHAGINEIANDLKVQTTVTILAGVLYSYKKVIEDDEKLDPSQIMRASETARQSKKFEITGSVVSGSWFRYSDRLPQPLEGVFSFHCPLLFHHILKKDAGFVNIEESLDLESNHTAIKNASGSDGGSSGEFFLFSQDNKLVIKTLTEKELIKLLDILPDYLQHLEQNPESLITRIYGVFSYRREFEVNSKHFLLMRNAAGVPPIYIARKYDLKGSTANRRTLVGQEFADKTLITESRTLKDLDFLKYEKKLQINEKVKPPLIASLDRDIEFLRSLNLMDYSIVIFVLNRKLILEQLGHVPKSACYNQISSIEDDMDPNWFYNLAIIDFLQEYRCAKMLENRFKRFKAAVFRCVWRYDISCQPPEKYARRLKAFIRNIIN